MSLPVITAVHIATPSAVEQDVALVFEYHRGITFQIITKSPVIGSVKFDGRLDYFESKFVVHFVTRSNEKQWIISLSEAQNHSKGAA